ncbi:hypothetical protein L1765_14675 [Microaerobacter geothermalis]|uniref:YkoP family protein n=1 Tax=Microaerobacter geothermalis TaxID=674972 RepID=UPI001F48767B|nr:hypothetical protein [Microaerobacter geothermalis]MCF6095205.1 hypothetical protein [Microaerobacter geothermalis]
MNYSMLAAWGILDQIYYLCNRLEYVSQKDNIFRVRLLKYRGPNLTLSDGTVIRSNDSLLKIHLHNQRLMKEMLSIKDGNQRAFYVYKQVKQSMPGLAQYLDQHIHSHVIKGIVGISILHRGAARLGFDVQEITNEWYKRYKLMYMKPMLILCHPEGRLRWTKRKDELVPKYIVMSKELLFNKYLTRT